MAQLTHQYNSILFGDRYTQLDSLSRYSSHHKLLGLEYQSLVLDNWSWLRIMYGTTII